MKNRTYCQEKTNGLQEFNTHTSAKVLGRLVLPALLLVFGGRLETHALAQNNNQPSLSIPSTGTNGSIVITSDQSCILQAADQVGGPYYNAGIGSVFTCDKNEASQFFRGVRYTEGGLGTVTGTITDPSGNPLPGLTVGLPCGGPSTTTDTNGNFTLEGLPAGTCLLKVSADISTTDPATGKVLYTITVHVNIHITVSADGSVTVEVTVLIGAGGAQAPCNCTPVAIMAVVAGGAQVAVGGFAVPPPAPAVANCGTPSVVLTTPDGVVHNLVPNQQMNFPTQCGGWTLAVTVCDIVQNAAAIFLCNYTVSGFIGTSPSGPMAGQVEVVGHADPPAPPAVACGGPPTITITMPDGKTMNLVSGQAYYYPPQSGVWTLTITVCGKITVYTQNIP
jgi:hypothetical protein